MCLGCCWCIFVLKLVLSGKLIVQPYYVIILMPVLDETGPQFKKDLLTAQIEAGGGTVIEDLDQQTVWDISFTL